MKNKFDIAKLILAIIITQMAGIIGSLATTSSIQTWYAKLIKPTFNPPNWIFAPVWLTLYLLMGIALYLVWQKGWDNPVVKQALIIFFIQLGLNALWSIIFFGLHQTLFAFITIILLWILILINIITFYKISNLAGIMLIPYILWVSFASILNLFIYLLNK